SWQVHVSCAERDQAGSLGRTWPDITYHDLPTMVGHDVVQASYGRVHSGLSRFALSTATAAGGAAIQHASGSARGRATAHRAGAARYPAAEFSGRVAEVSRCDLHAR